MIQPPNMNAVGIIGAGVARMAIGALWYSPLLFVKAWSKLAGVSEAQMKAGMAKALTIDVIGSLLMSFVLIHSIRYAGATTPLEGMAVAFWHWLGFVAVATIGNVTFERRPFKLFLINNGYMLVSLLVMGAILAVWG